MKFRPFQPEDAEFCFRVRSQAFIQEFYGELTAEEVAAGVNVYMPSDFVRMAEALPFFIVEEKDLPLGFFVLKKKDVRTAELLLIYIDLQHLDKGIGKACIEFIETWLALNWSNVSRLIVDTVIPKYNSEFYQQMGFVPSEETFCDFKGVKVPALQLCKTLNH